MELRLTGNPSRSPQTDVYSLGVLLFHLLTGTYPVGGGNLQEVREAHTLGKRIALGVAARSAEHDRRRDRACDRSRSHESLRRSGSVGFRAHDASCIRRRRSLCRNARRRDGVESTGTAKPAILGEQPSLVAGRRLRSRFSEASRCGSPREAAQNRRRTTHSTLKSNSSRSSRLPRREGSGRHTSTPCVSVRLLPRWTKRWHRDLCAWRASRPRCCSSPYGHFRVIDLSKNALSIVSVRLGVASGSQTDIAA